MKHPDLAAEQSHLDAAYRHAERMRARAEEFSGRDDLASGEVDAQILQHHFRERAAALANAMRGTLCFGRIDERADRFYIGRTHIEDEAATPLVIDWRARAAIPFYRATVANPLGLDGRRRFVVDGRILLDILEEDFNDPDSAVLAGGGVPDPLLAELGRARTGRMRDIVATIQAEQDEVIRAPLAECLIVQGGPGTGKTAVGLHRAAFLLYEHRDRLTREGVLVVGPNPLFLDYISQVLPTLGERSVTQATVESLLGKFRDGPDGVDTPEAAAVKASERMAVVIRQGARDASISLPSEDLEVPFRTRFLRVTAKEVGELIEAAAEGDGPWAVRRNNFRSTLFRTLRDRYPDETTADAVAAAVAASAPARRAIDGMWKTVGGVTLVNRLLTSRAALARAAAGVLSAEEQAAILRPKAARPAWTRWDLPLLDEAEAFITGAGNRYGHIVVDEAQDRTPMELRVIGRRSASGSMTILGDLAQATAIGGTTSWASSADHLGVPVEPRLVELTIGYRVPAAVLDFANRLLPFAAAGVTAAQSVREEGDPPSIVECPDAAAVLDEAAELGAVFGKRYATAAVIAPRRMIDDLAARLRALEVSFAGDASGSLEGEVALLTASAAKGLEFDAVVVVEPAAVVADEPGAERALFVALTRAVQHLSILHADPLPAPLRSAQEDSSAT